MKTKSVIIAILAFILAGPLMAQDDISPERKTAIDSLALEKIRDLSKYISIIGNKSTPFSEANRVIDRTLELFVEEAQMGVSSLYKEEIKNYPVRKYLERLMALNYNQMAGMLV